MNHAPPFHLRLADARGVGNRNSPRLRRGERTLSLQCVKKLDYLADLEETRSIMGRGRKQKVQKMKNRKRQSKKKASLKKKRELVHKSRLA